MRGRGSAIAMGCGLLAASVALLLWSELAQSYTLIVSLMGGFGTASLLCGLCAPHWWRAPSGRKTTPGTSADGPT